MAGCDRPGTAGSTTVALTCDASTWPVRRLAYTPTLAAAPQHTAAATVQTIRAARPVWTPRSMRSGTPNVRLSRPAQIDRRGWCVLWLVAIVLTRFREPPGLLLMSCRNQV
jgi:hypothetical protein